MAPKTLATLATDLASTADIDVALRIVNDELGADKHAGVSLLAFDGRRNTIFDRRALTPPGGTERAQVGIDHLPVTVRYAVLAGQRFADVGDQAAQYARLLGIPVEGDDVRLYLKGIVIDGALSGVLALFERRRRGTSKIAERAEPLAALFEVVFARFFEREARFEAIAALHEVTERLRGEHAATLTQMEHDIARLRLASGEVVDHRRVMELDAANERLRHRAETAERRLAAVEEQVTSAVGRLERAHMQIHQQSETLREQIERIRSLEATIAEQTLASRLRPEAELRQPRDDRADSAEQRISSHS
jgi:chromosome segregation ATPase